MIRDIRKLEGDIKREYGLVLASFFTSLKDTDAFQLRALYKILAYIELNKKHRKSILHSLMTDKLKEESLHHRIELLLNMVKGQERDILRFTLMEDFLTIAKANSYMSDEKKALIEKVQAYLLITDEQMEIFEQELDSEGVLSLKENNQSINHSLKIKLSKGLALGVPLLFLYYSPHNAYRHKFSTFTLLQIDKKLNPQKSVYSLGKYFVLGGFLYKSVVWGLNQKVRRQNKLTKILIEENQRLLNRSEKFLEEDISYCQKAFNKNISNESQKHYKMLMEKTLKIISE